MRFGIIALAALALPIPGAALQVRAQVSTPLETRIWLDGGVDPVFQKGDEARIFYRASSDAYLVLVHVNTDGALRLLFPGGRGEAVQAAAGQDYELIFSGSGPWTVEEAPGVGYFFVLASTEPFEFDRLNRLSVAGGWNSTDEGNRIAMDPFVAVNEFKQTLLPGVGAEAYAIDFTTYHVGQPYSYPRFLCSQCHEAQSFEAFNPYLQTCPEVRVVIYNDPYYYPATRYEDDRVVYPRPPQPGLPQFTFVARGIGEVGTPVVRSRLAARSVFPAGPEASADVPLRGTGDLLRSVGQQTGAAGGTGFVSPLTGAGIQATPTNAAGVRFPDLPVVTDGAQAGGRPTLRRRGSDSSR